MVCPEESPQCARRRNSPPPVGIDAPTPTRIGTGRPKGRSHFSFGGERKVCKRKPAARRLREKALYCPFLKEGVRNVARSTVGLPTFTFVRARAHSFPLSKRARLFPSAAYRRSASPQLAWGILTPCRLGCFDAVGGLCGVDEWAAFPFSSWRGAGLPLACRNTSKWLGYFCNAKGQHGFRATLACIASHEARCRMAVYARQPAGSRTKPASREACRRAAVALRPSRMSLEHPARLRRAVRGQGRREEARAQWAQPPQAVSDRQPSTETRI